MIYMLVVSNPLRFDGSPIKNAVSLYEEDVSNPLRFDGSRVACVHLSFM